MNYSIFVYICEIKGVFFVMTNNSSVLKDEAMKTETNTTRSTYEIKENTHKTKSK
jgi:hypothetical protein